jgi:hypothetical protein
MACSLPAEQGVPLSRWSASELAREAIGRGIVEQISGVTVWRWLSKDAIKPWQHRSWIFPRDPRFAERAGPILDLYAGCWRGERLHPGDYVICADEKPSIQARKRIHPTLPARRGGGQMVEHEYERMGALCYLAAWDARRAKIFDRCAAKDGIEPFDALVDQFMPQMPYKRARRVFLIIDNGSAHRGKRSIDRLQGTWPNLILVHTPVHASWLNQAEIYFSVVQRKLVTPNDFADLDTLQAQLLAFGRRYEQIAAPFQWKFTRQDLHKLLAKTDTKQPASLDTCANLRARPLSVRGLLSETLLAAFPTLSAEAQGTETALTGTLADQAALYGVLAQIEPLGLELIEVRRTHS